VTFVSDAPRIDLNRPYGGDVMLDGKPFRVSGSALLDYRGRPVPGGRLP
jgi:hypothetical protein